MGIRRTLTMQGGDYDGRSFEFFAPFPPELVFQKFADGKWWTHSYLRGPSPSTTYSLACVTKRGVA